MNYKLLAATTAATCAIACAPLAVAADVTDADRYQPSFHTEPRYVPLVPGQLYTESTRFTPTGAPEGTTFWVAGGEKRKGCPSLPRSKTTRPLSCASSSSTATKSKPGSSTHRVAPPSSAAKTPANSTSV
ncbi:hypothetical protein [Corynebacterium sp. UMB2355A]|uniref:hypothetical protein n=1 Tax=Corynebacterium sp. UMB2355A TaxID=3081222 RepID=UPI0029FEEFC4|nr:hypothetical protein [Corynebacterium sp. UMB2355A]WPJ93293.1 hypothetical protein R0V12_02710 [Corynebacterium sp. UMB2355A]